MLVLLYFDWFGTTEELKKEEEKMIATCAKANGIEYKGRYYPHNRKFHFVYLFEAESFKRLLDTVGAETPRDYKKLTHGQFELLAGPLQDSTTLSPLRQCAQALYDDKEQRELDDWVEAKRDQRELDRSRSNEIGEQKWLQFQCKKQEFERFMCGSKVWSSPEWRRKRAEFIKGKVCEWCGSTEKLTVHHKKPPPKYKAFVRHLTRILRDQKVTAGEFKYQIESRKVCPRCGRRAFYKRTTMKPLYRCNNCGSQFDKAKNVRGKTRRLSKADFRVFWKKYGLKIREQAYELAQKAHGYYMSLQDCMVLCKRCNFALHNGKVLCKVCRKKYHLKKYFKCWDCLPDSSWKRELEQMHKRVETRTPCGSKITVEAEELELAGFLFVCLNHCPNNKDINDCADFSKWYEAEIESMEARAHY